MSTGRSTTVRDQHRAVIRRGKPPCGIYLLHGPGDAAVIDYSLRSPHPMSFEVDHVIPLNKGGADTLENKGASHRICNRKKWDSLAEDHIPRGFVTWRSW